METFLLIIGFLIVLLWSKLPKNIYYYYKNRPLKEIFILCNKRLILGLQILGGLLIIIKFSITGAKQEDFNNLLAEALISNIHVTSMLYQAERRVIPSSIPVGFKNKDADIKKEFIKEPHLMFDEMHEYVRRSSKLITQYFGIKYPSCNFHGTNINLLNFDPDAEVVAFEIQRRNEKIKDCGSLDLSIGLVDKLKIQKIRFFQLDIIGALFIFLSLFLRYIVLIYEEKSQYKSKNKWCLDQKNIKQ